MAWVVRLLLALLVVGVSVGCVEEGRRDDDGCGDSHEQENVGATRLPIVVAQPGQFTFVTFDVGQGDAAVAITPSGCAALFDGGPTGAGAVIKTNLQALGVTRLDFAFVSHFHADHIGGLDEVDSGTDAVPIGTVFDRGGTYASVAFDQYASRFQGRRVTPALGSTISLCDGQATLKVVAVNGNGVTTTDENAKSLVVKLSYGAFDALVGGDLTGAAPDVESAIKATVGEIELYKVHHHGSLTSSNAAFLAATRPTVSFISLGANNSYGHPAPETVGRLQEVGSAIWMTEDSTLKTKLGHVQLTSTNGREFTVEQGASRVTYGSKTMPDTTAPSAPSDLTATSVSSSQIDLRWGASTDDVGVALYRIERALDGVTFAPLAETSGTTWSDAGLAGKTSYSYRVVARDAAGNESAASAAVTVTTPAPPDTTAPTTPGGLAAAAVSSSRIDLRWDASTDDVGVALYRIERSAGGASFAPLVETSSTTWSDTGLAAQTGYAYRVVARDAAGNESAASAAASATTPPPPDTTAPSSPSGLSATAASTSQIDLRWDASIDDVGVVLYRIERSTGGSSFATLVETAGTTWSDTGLAAQTSYAYRVVARDAAGNESAASAVVSATTKSPPDTSAPSAPALSVAGITSSSVSLAWTASTDNVGVAGYRVMRDGVLVATTTARTFLDTGLSPDRSYAYSVRAFDAAGNLSTEAKVSATTACSVQIGALAWSAPKRELSIRATCSRAGAKLSASADGTLLGAMTYEKGSYVLKQRLASRPACVRVTGDCAGVADQCF